MKKNKKDIKVEVTYTEGYQERFTKAVLEMYERIKKEKTIRDIEEENEKERDDTRE